MTEQKRMGHLELIFDSNRGTYIPQHFADITTDWNVSTDDIETLKKGEECEWYWDTWDRVLNNAEHTDKDGKLWRLHHDGDLWAYCEDENGPDDLSQFFGDD